MRFNFQEPEDTPDSRRSPTPKEPVRWVPLQSHPVFASLPSSQDEPTPSQRFPRNFMAWDGDSRLYYWDSRRYLLHRFSLRLGEPEPSSVLAAVPSKVMQPDLQMTISVSKISINKSGSAVLLAGSDGICVMYLFGRASVVEDNVICRVVSIGSEIYTSGDSAINLLQASWHPDSDTHLGILSSDAVFRLFDLSYDAELPEQEYYLQPGEPGSSRTASSIYPADFSFGGEHLWDRFTVFILFTDGSIYILCPVVPFGSVYKWESIMEIYHDANMYGVKSSNSIAVSNSSLAIEWLEATFPDLTEQGTRGENILVVKAHPYALLDASLALQGPLYKASNGDGDEDFAVREAECKGRAVSLLYNLVSKDSILVTAWSAGQLQVDALVDEIQPVWISGELTVATSNLPLDHTVWLGHPPPLLRLAMVDLALPTRREGGSLVTLFADSLLPERIYSLHDGGIDSTVLHSLPFTSQATGKDEALKTPSVHTVLSTCQEESAVSPLLGFVPLSDSFGYAWIIAVLSSGECIVAEMKTWDLLLPIHVGTDKTVSSSEIEKKEQDNSCIISKELLAGPKIRIVPHALPTQRSTPANSVEGRSILLDYVKLFHENYIEYAHKVYFELQHHAPNLKRIIDDQHQRLAEANEKISKVDKNQSFLEKRIDKAIQRHDSLEQRLQRLRSLPGTHKKPLTRAELDFKSELDQYAGVEVDALQSSIETLRARVKKSAQKSPKGTVVAATQKKQYSRKNLIQDTQMSQLQSTLAKLSLMNSDNSKKVKIVESALKSQESSFM
ncbi:nuclear pore complex protein NUP88 isoform X2 [Arabidopsis lyrata subsp. lyrata]|uniref:nuclear pore complex protein NUP88 isoform X2 n=1 Tax=Arabidopsis lyrata subsp. lyrata TaxID=81972 RepID=UPI000A29CCEE|nr:nuclear pore complex protein NUP88 isoform X2 [Arabidopsis lyrata subsp. lyrata]|eukprot:XP_020875927.1 nuclear pore complex protein NUP88 isoform X2 [Arabidopsis lyrata subsp. lyrata]